MGKQDRIVQKMLLETCVPILKTMRLRFGESFGGGSVITHVLGAAVNNMEAEYGKIIKEENAEKARRGSN